MEGEVTNRKSSAAGHHYFSLKDSRALLNAVLFRGQAGLISFLPKEGERVIAEGRLSLYEAGGRYQLVCRTLRKTGEGELLALWEERKRRWAAEGLFEKQKSLSCPSVPRKIIVITSEKGAAVHDVLQVLKRRRPDMDVLLFSCSVQGSGAAREISLRIRQASRSPNGELILLVRGGGSPEDLAAFSEEPVIRSIAESRLPVITGIGHEVDLTLADWAAFHRAATPTAAAEVISPSREELLHRLRSFRIRTEQAWQNRFLGLKSRLQRQNRNFWEESFRRRLEAALLKLDDLKEALVRDISFCLEEKKRRAARLRENLLRDSPQRILERGYACVFRSKTGEAVLEAGEKLVGEELILSMKNGKLRTEVKEFEEDERGQ